MKVTFKTGVFILMSITLLSVLKANAQITAIQNKLDNYRQQNLIEKLYVHTDKQFYLTGEIMWFKIYAVNASTNKAVSVSKIAYIDVLDRSNNAVMQAKIALDQGLGSGSLYIPVTLANGNYKLRAYTNWMKNYSPDFYFEKQISIVNPLRSPDVQAAEKTPEPDIQFFPEGGNLINGVANKVAFKITAANGKGQNLSGALVNQRNDTIARFKPLMFGLGSFLFTPAANDAYKAVFKSEGKTIVKQLPAAATQGYNMLLLSENEKDIKLTVNSNQANGTLYVIAHSSQSVNIAQTAALNNGSVTFTIDKAKLAEGINHLTIFDSAYRPVCERLYFKRPQQKLIVNAIADNTYSVRAKAGISLTTQNGAGKATAANLSLSVYRVDSLQQKDGSGIYSYLWLTSELKGNIESPEYYFNNTSPATDAALDNLMLTQGWSRFEWKDVLSGNKPVVKFLPEYNGHLVTAKISTAAGNAAPSVIAYLGVPGKRVQMYAALSDTTGQLLFNTKDFYGPGEIILQTKNDKERNYLIEVQSPFSGQYSSSRYPALQPNAMPAALLENYSIAMQVQNLYASTNIRQFYNPGADSSAFYFKPSKIYKLDDYTRFTTMEELFKEYIAEGSLFKSKNSFHIRTLGKEGPVGEDPLVLIDGIPFFDTDKIANADPLKIERLEVVDTRYYYGPTANEGIFSFTTYKGDLGGVELDPRAVVIDYEGMQLQRRFYSPVYDAPAQTKSRIPDRRNVLYWSPAANTDATGKKQVSFYTSDQPGKYIAVIEGISQNGEAGSGYVTFEVK